jgi:hypothetical protein
MKTLATIFFIIFIGTAAQAQNATEDVKVETVEMTIATETTNELKVATKTQVARLYRLNNARVTKALSFTTKRSKAKMA